MDFQQTTLANINIIRQLTNTLGGGFTKSLGQNFLINQNSLLRFINSINPVNGDIVVEIGPGIGVVSYTLCQKVKKVYLIEIDKTKEEALKKTLENFSNYEIIWADAADFDFKSLNIEGNIKVIGSLPYNVSKRIIANLFRCDFSWEVASFFLQKEVAESYTSKAPNNEFLKVFASIYSTTQYLFTIPPEHFMPKPKVKTGVIKFTKTNNFVDIDKTNFSSFIKAGFAQPRKTIQNNLKSFSLTEEDLLSTGLKSKVRPSEIEVNDWLKIYNIYKNKKTA